MADTRAAHTETAEPRAAADARHVHGAVPDRVLPGAQAVHHMQHSVPGGRVPDMLQRVRQLHILQQQLRLGAVRQRLTMAARAAAAFLASEPGTPPLRGRRGDAFDARWVGRAVSTAQCAAHARHAYNTTTATTTTTTTLVFRKLNVMLHLL